MNEGKMKALVFYGPDDFRIEEREIPAYSSDEMLIKVRYGGVCGTDNRIRTGAKVIAAPRITGHEFVGTVEGIGKNVKGYSLGERVTVYPMIHCGKCYACKAGKTNICVNRKTIGYEIDGGFAQYVKIPREAIECGNVIKIPDEVSDEIAAIAEPITAAYHGIQQSKLQAGQCFVIVGAGPIGQFHVQLAATKNPGDLIVIEPRKEKRDMALEMGAKCVIDPDKEDAKSVIFDRTNQEGADAVIVDVGVPSALEQSLGYVKKGGRVIIFAGMKNGTTVTFEPNTIHYKEIVLTGSSASSAAIEKEVLELLKDKKMDVKNMISGIFALEDWEQAFDMKANYVGIKTILDPWK